MNFLVWSNIILIVALVVHIVVSNYQFDKIRQELVQQKMALSMLNRAMRTRQTTIKAHRTSERTPLVDAKPRTTQPDFATPATSRISTAVHRRSSRAPGNDSLD